MTEYGIWSESAGGVIETQLWSLGEADERLTAFRSADPDDTLRVIPVCPLHDGQPYGDDCEECD